MALKPAANREVWPTDLVGVQQDNVIAELGELPRRRPVVKAARVAGVHDDDATLALGWEALLPRVRQRNGDPKDDQSEDYGRGAR
jgi:hypothetical protein